MYMYNCTSKIANNLTVLLDQHIWHYEHLWLYDITISISICISNVFKISPA